MGKKKYKTELEERIRDKLGKRNITWLASRLGISTQTIRLWFSGELEVREVYKMLLPRVLHTKRIELFPEEDSNEKQDA